MVLDFTTLADHIFSKYALESRNAQHFAVSQNATPIQHTRVGLFNGQVAP